MYLGIVPTRVKAACLLVSFRNNCKRPTDSFCFSFIAGFMDECSKHLVSDSGSHNMECTDISFSERVFPSLLMTGVLVPKNPSPPSIRNSPLSSLIRMRLTTLTMSHRQKVPDPKTKRADDTGDVPHVDLGFTNFVYHNHALLPTQSLTASKSPGVEY